MSCARLATIQNMQSSSETLILLYLFNISMNKIHIWSNRPTVFWIVENVTDKNNILDSEAVSVLMTDLKINNNLLSVFVVVVVQYKYNIYKYKDKNKTKEKIWYVNLCELDRVEGILEM